MAHEKLDYRDATAARPCPVCGRKKDCAHTLQGVILCRWPISKGGGVPMPAPSGYAMGKRARDGGQFYLPVDAGGKPARSPATEEERLAREKRDREYQAWRIKTGRQLWREARPEDPGLLDYLRARGIDPARLPPAIFSHALRMHPAAMLAKEGGKWYRTRAMIACVLGPEVGGIAGDDGRPRKIWDGVHATYLDEREPAKCRRFPEKTKVKWGPFKGRAIRLAEDFPGAVLVIAEGIETALSCVDALHGHEGWGAWAAGDAQNLIDLVLPAWLIDPFASPAIAGVVFAADLDGPQARPGGQAKARRAAAQLRERCPWLSVDVRVPTAAAFPELVEVVREDGEDREYPKGGAKSVDWNDVLIACGRDRLRAALVEGIDGGASERAAEWAAAHAEEREVVRARLGSGSWEGGGDGGGGEASNGGGEGGGGAKRPVIPGSKIKRAEMFLEARRVPTGDRARSRWTHAHVNGRHMLWEGRCYREVHEDAEVALRNEAKRWLEGFDTIRAARGGKGEEERVPFHPGDHVAKELIADVAGETFVRAEELPVWLAPTFDAEGSPIHGIGHWDRVDGRGLPDAAWVMPFPGGLLDGQAWVDGQVRVIPHTPRFLSTAVLPFDVSLKDLAAASKADDLDGLAERLAPDLRPFLDSIVGADGETAGTLMEWAGYAITVLKHLEHGNILIVTGHGGSGKGTLAGLIARLVGEENTVATSLDSLMRPFHLSSWLGKRLANMGEINEQAFHGYGLAVERLKLIAGRDPVPIDRKNKDELPFQRLPAKVLMGCNTLPDFRDPSGAIMRRTLVVEVARRAEIDPDLKDRLWSQLPGVMVCVLAAQRRLFRRGHFVQPAASASAVETLELSVSLQRRFVDEVLVYHEGGIVRDAEGLAQAAFGGPRRAFIADGELYAAWKQYAESRGLQRVGVDSALWRALRPLWQLRRWRVERREVDGRWGWLGLMLDRRSLAAEPAQHDLPV